MIAPQFRPMVGGYERAAERLSQALVARGHEIQVATEKRVSSWLSDEVIHGVHVHRVRCIYRRGVHQATSLTAFAVYLCTAGRRFDVWHVHQYGNLGALAIAIARVLRKPVVLKSTSSQGQGIETVTKGLVLRRFAAPLLRDVDALVALTRETSDEAVQFGVPSNRVHVIGNGIDTGTFFPRTGDDRLRLRQSLGIEAEGIVLCVARNSPEKNLSGLLAAWRMATSMPTGWKLVVVGDGLLGSDLERQVNEQRLTTSVVLKPSQPIESWMAAADIFALASHWEGLSNTTLEAMACGIPVASTRVSGSLETLQEPGAGIVGDVGDMAMLADALVRLAHDPALRAQMGAAGRSVIEARYSLELIAERHEQLYRQVVADSGSRVIAH